MLSKLFYRRYLISLSYLLMVIVGIILLCLGSCSSRPEVKIPDRIKGMENLTVYPVPENPDTVYLERQQTFGNEEVLVGSYSIVTVDNNGRVYIGDNRQKCIHVFRSDGEFLAQLGKEGRGPGEFSYIAALGIVAGKLRAVDIRQARVNIFLLDPISFSETRNIAPTNLGTIEELKGAQQSRYVIRNDGNYLVKFNWPRNMTEVEEEQYTPYYIMDGRGALRSEKALELRDLIFLTTEINGNTRASTFPFTPWSILALSEEDKIYSAWTRDFLIKIHRPDGEYVRSFYYPYEKVPLERDQLLEKYPLEMHQKMIRSADLPETLPALNSMLFDNNNRLWVSTVVEEKKVYQWWVLNMEGELIARFRWPRNKEIKAVKNDYLYALESNKETGEQKLARYRVNVASR